MGERERGEGLKLRRQMHFTTVFANRYLQHCALHSHYLHYLLFPLHPRFT